MTEHEVETIVESLINKVDRIYLGDGAMMTQSEYMLLIKKIDEWSKSVKINKPA